MENSGSSSQAEGSKKRKVEELDTISNDAHSSHDSADVIEKKQKHYNDDLANLGNVMTITDSKDDDTTSRADSFGVPASQEVIEIEPGDEDEEVNSSHGWEYESIALSTVLDSDEDEDPYPREVIEIEDDANEKMSDDMEESNVPVNARTTLQQDSVLCDTTAKLADTGPDTTSLEVDFKAAIGDGLYNDIRNIAEAIGQVSGDKVLNNEDGELVNLVDLADLSQEVDISNESQTLVAGQQSSVSTTQATVAVEETDPEVLAKQAADAEHKRLCSKWYRTLHTEHQETAKELNSKLENWLATSENKDTTEKKPKQWATQGPHPMTVDEVNARLRGAEERIRSWIVTASSPAELPPGGLLMRVEDAKSMARMYPEVGAMSQGSPLVLNTYTARKRSLENQFHWGGKEPTAWISVTGCIKDLWEKRISHMLIRDANSPTPTGKLVFINGYARNAEGWVTLKATTVIDAYKCKTPISRDSPWFLHEYLMAFRAPPSQIVATYCWPVVKKYMDDHGCDFYAWFHAIVMPAFQEHEAARQEGRPVRGNAGCVCCGH